MKSKAITCLIIFCLFVVSFLGCQTATKRTVPNVSIVNPSYPLSETSIDAVKARKLLSDLAKDNPLFAGELGKLPELHDGITSADIRALEEIIEVYNRNSKRFDEVFIEMNKVGIPEVRKYCAPLQAIFWIAEQNGAEHIESILCFYSENPSDTSLKKVLNEAWRFSEISRWGNFQDIIDRLNSPELFEWWFASNFIYDWNKFGEYLYKSDGYPQSAEKTVRTRRGVCFDAAYVAYVCLRRAGYEATGLNVYGRPKNPRGASVHCVCLIKGNLELKNATQEKRFFVIADTTNQGVIAGPFISVREAAEHVARRFGVTLKTYTMGSPSYTSTYLW